MNSASTACGLAGERRAVTGRKKESIARAGPALRKPIGVAGEERMTQRLVVNVRRDIAVERTARDTLQLVRDLHAPSHPSHPSHLDSHPSHPSHPVTTRARRRGLGRAATVYQDAREPRMEGNALQLPAERRDAGACVITIDRAEAAQQTECRVNAIGRRRFEPVERQRIGAPCEQIEDRAREIDASDFGFTMRPQPIARIPQPAHEARPQPRRAARRAAPPNRASCARA